jgi:hypothetical protein
LKVLELFPQEEISQLQKIVNAKGLEITFLNPYDSISEQKIQENSSSDDEFKDFIETEASLIEKEMEKNNEDLSFIEYGHANLPKLNSLVEKASLVWERKI